MWEASSFASAIYAICSLGSAVYGINMAFIALLTGIVYAAVTVIFGSISGAQFNPAVSVAAMLTGKTHVLDGILYIIAQVLGGIGAGAAILVPSADFRAGDIQDLDDTNGQRISIRIPSPTHPRQLWSDPRHHSGHRR